MTQKRVGLIRRSGRLFWRLVTGLRSLLANLLFLAVLAAIVLALTVDDSEVIDTDSVLLLAPSGQIVEQRSFVDPLVRVLDPEIIESETVLHDLIDAVDAARSDTRIKAMVIDLNRLRGIGFSAARELGVAVRKFRESGKPVLAMSDSYDQQRYLLASFADEVYLHTMGGVAIRGFGVYPTYYRELLERLKVDMHVFRVGEYKAAVEPFIRDDMSPQAKLNSLRWLQALWDEYLALLEANRDLEPSALERYVNEFDVALLSADGDMARAALNAGLVDQVLSREETLEQIGERIEGDPKETMVHYYSYLDDVRGAAEDEAEHAVAVIVAEGMIVDGERPPGMAGGDTVAAQLRQAREDERVKAVVLRVNSEGGSVFASEIIREQVQLVQQADKPVIASMSGIAASGGYWIAAGADQIWAQPSTITGSIGIFGVFPSLYRSFSHWGINSDGVGTTRLADGYRMDRPMSEVTRRSVQAMVERGYGRFVKLVAEARGLSEDDVDRVAQGQVWSGRQAMEQGLVDHLGGVDQAIEAAAALVGISNYETLWMADQNWLDTSLWQRLWAGMSASLIEQGVKTVFGERRPGTALLPLTKLPVLNDPGGLYLHCMECVSIQ